MSVINSVFVPSFLKIKVKDTTSPAFNEPKLCISSEKTNLATPYSSDFPKGKAFFVPELHEKSNRPNRIEMNAISFNLKPVTCNLKLVFILLLRQLNHVRP